MPGNTIEITDSNFEAEVISSDLPVLIDFWAPWCGPCRAIAPHVDAIATEYDGRMKVGKINIDESQDAATRYRVTSIPTLLIFRDGQVVGQIRGAQPKPALVSAIDKALA